MTQPTNTFDSYDAIGNREDLEDVIYDISPTETPFVTMAGRGSCSAVLHEWQTDALAAAAANRQVEGDDATGNTLTPTTRLTNYCQISRKVVVTAGTQNANKSAGRSDREQAYQMLKAGKELKRDIEYACVRNQASSAGGSSTARSLASVESWLSTNKTSLGTGTAQTTPGFSSGTVAAPTDSSVAGTFTEAALKAIIQECWSQGGEPDIVMVGPKNKQRASAFAGIATQYKDNKSGPATIIAAADVYISDFGEHKIVPNRFSRDQTALVLDMNYWSIAYLRPINRVQLAKTGDSEKEMLITEYTLVSKNQAASGKIADLVV